MPLLSLLCSGPEGSRTLTPKNWYLKPARLPIPPRARGLGLRSIAIICTFIFT